MKNKPTFAILDIKYITLTSLSYKILEYQKAFYLMELQ